MRNQGETKENKVHIFLNVQMIQGSTHIYPQDFNWVKEALGGESDQLEGS